jgi:light-regulated signal transduction histidine kinase (bacteriophytochrome)
VRLALEDNGIGVSPQDHERILHVFERLHGSEAYPRHRHWFGHRA